MSKIKFKIDEKSLFYGVFNDYAKGQTATVSTPINQSKDPDKWHKDIIELYTSGLSINTLPEHLIDKCLSKTTSQANSKIDFFFEFCNLYLDGVKLNTSSSFGMYVKEETDKFIKRKTDGTMGVNTHLGRQKLHYPITLVYKTDGFDIDNKDVLDCILSQNGEFAYVVRGFECDTETKSLNFLTSLIGMKGILLSNVFRIQKGVGKKLLVDEIDLEAQDVYSDSGMLFSTKEQGSNSNPDFDKLNQAKVENGVLGENFVYENIKKLIGEYVEDVYHTSKFYPTSPYDIEYTENGVKKYLEVKATSGEKEVFNMSSGEMKFMKQYKDNYTLILVTEVRNEFPKVRKFECDKILSMRKEYPSVRFYAK